MEMSLELKWTPTGYFIFITQGYSVWKVRVPAGTLGGALSWFNRYAHRLQMEFEDGCFDLAPYEVPKESKVDEAVFVLTHINGDLWIAEIKLDGDDNIYRTPIEARDEAEATDKTEAVIREMASYLGESNVPQ